MQHANTGRRKLWIAVFVIVGLLAGCGNSADSRDWKATYFGAYDGKLGGTVSFIPCYQYEAFPMESYLALSNAGDNSFITLSLPVTARPGTYAFAAAKDDGPVISVNLDRDGGLIPWVYDDILSGELTISAYPNQPGQAMTGEFAARLPALGNPEAVITVRGSFDFVAGDKWPFDCRQ